MKLKSYLLAGIVVTAVLALSGCPGLFDGFPLTPLQRVQAFIDDVDVDSPDIADIKGHFHPNTSDLPTMDETYLEGTMFDPATRPFTFGSLTEGGENADYQGSVTVTVPFTSEVDGTTFLDTTLEFTLLPDPDLVDNWLIRQILNTEEPTDVINNVK